MALGTLMHRHPARGFGRDFDRLVEDLWNGFALRPVQTTGPSGPANDERSYRPRLDATDLEHEYVVHAELPGVEPEAVEVTVHDGLLTLKGERVWGEAKASFEEKVRFPGEIVEEEVKAVHKNGVLTVTVPKHVPAQPEVRAIPIQTS